MFERYKSLNALPGPPPGSLAWGVAGVGVEGVGKRSWGVPGPRGV